MKTDIERALSNPFPPLCTTFFQFWVLMQHTKEHARFSSAFHCRGGVIVHSHRSIMLDGLREQEIDRQVLVVPQLLMRRGAPGFKEHFKCCLKVKNVLTTKKCQDIHVFV
jgi:hypothetical protein